MSDDLMNMLTSAHAKASALVAAKQDELEAVVTGLRAELEELRRDVVDLETHIATQRERDRQVNPAGLAVPSAADWSQEDTWTPWIGKRITVSYADGSTVTGVLEDTSYRRYRLTDVPGYPADEVFVGALVSVTGLVPAELATQAGPVPLGVATWVGLVGQHVTLTDKDGILTGLLLGVSVDVITLRTEHGEAIVPTENVIEVVPAVPVDSHPTGAHQLPDPASTLTDPPAATPKDGA